jgi:hypothetical protein
MGKDFENNDKNRKDGDFGLPEGYFEKSGRNILNKLEWLEEHKIYSQLSELKNSAPGFIVPEGYFDRAEHKLELIAYEKLAGKNKENGFITPLNYLEELEITELSKVMKEEGNELRQFARLSSLEKKNAFGIPENYFESSAEKISSIASGKSSEAKVIRLSSNRFWYSAAAAVMGVVLGLWIYNQYFKVKATGDCGTLACVDKADLVKSKVMESMDDEDIYNMVDTKKLEENLKGNSSGNEKNKKDTDSSAADETDLMHEF